MKPENLGRYIVDFFVSRPDFDQVLKNHAALMLLEPGLRTEAPWRHLHSSFAAYAVSDGIDPADAATWSQVMCERIDFHFDVLSHAVSTIGGTA